MYFHKITNHFKNVVGPHKPSKRCDRLFLDFNGIVHNCARDVKQSVALNAPVEVFEDALLDAVISYTEKVCAYANTKSLFCICVDGVAPLAKIMQASTTKTQSLRSVGPLMPCRQSCPQSTRH